MKVALCAIAKLENHYIREWVEYHKSIGFDHIFLYDNNDIDGERLSTEIQDYIDSNYITIIEAFGIKGYQIEAYNTLYHSELLNGYDWVMFIDIDEFVTFVEDNMTIQKFLTQNEELFKDKISIGFQWHYFDDNNLAKVENNNYNVLTRFTHDPHIVNRAWSYKQIVRTGIQDLYINSAHLISEFYNPSESQLKLQNSKELAEKVCDTLGRVLKSPSGYRETDELPKCPAYIRHFKYKTIEEYINLKMKRGYPMPHRNYGTLLTLQEFFALNTPTYEKIEFVKNWLDSRKLTEKEMVNCIEQLVWLLPPELFKILDPDGKIMEHFKENTKKFLKH